MYHVVISTTHYQGASRRPIAIAPDAKTAAHVAALLSTCSFCGGRRLGAYQTGTCVYEDTMRVRPHAPELPDDAGAWSRADVEAWLNQADEDDN